MTVHLMDIRVLMDVWRPGSGDHSWVDEASDLWGRESDQMNAWELDIEAGGFPGHVLLGHDGRVWDGHHRLIAALAVGVKKVPFEFMPSSVLTS